MMPTHRPSAPLGSPQRGSSGVTTFANPVIAARFQCSTGWTDIGRVTAQPTAGRMVALMQNSGDSWTWTNGPEGWMPVEIDGRPHAHLSDALPCTMTLTVVDAEELMDMRGGHPDAMVCANHSNGR